MPKAKPISAFNDPTADRRMRGNHVDMWFILFSRDGTPFHSIRTGGASKPSVVARVKQWIPTSPLFKKKGKYTMKIRMLDPDEY